MDDSFWIFYYFLAPLAIFLFFALSMYWSDQKNPLREGALFIFFIPAMLLIAAIGFSAWLINYEPLTILTAALAQSVPLSFTTFRYSEAKSEAESRKLNFRLDEMEKEIVSLREQLEEMRGAR